MAASGKPVRWSSVLCAVLVFVALVLPSANGQRTVQGAQEDETHEVKPKEEAVKKNAKIDHEGGLWGEDPEEVAPQDVTSDATGKVTIVTKTFKPPQDWNFKAFDHDETPPEVRARLKSDINPGTYVDVVLDPDGLIYDETTVTVAPDGEQAIKITVSKITVPETAAEFPLKCEGNLRPPPGGSGDHAWHWSAKMGIKALVARYLWGWGSQIDQIVGSTESLGYTVTEDNSLAKSEAIDYAPKHIVWYTLSHGHYENDRWVGSEYGGGVLRPGDLPGALRYTLVFLCACGSASGDDVQMANAFGAKAYVGWKNPMNESVAVSFSLYFFEELDGRTPVGLAATNALGRFMNGSAGWRWVHDNIKVVRGTNVIVDLRPK
jgi:hypothetical protein